MHVRLYPNDVAMTVANHSLVDSPVIAKALNMMMVVMMMASMMMMNGDDDDVGDVRRLSQTFTVQ